MPSPAANRLSVLTLLGRVPLSIRLTIIGLITAGLFYIILSGRYSLFVQGPLAQQSLATMNQNSLDSALWYLALFALLFGLYWLGSRWLKQSNTNLWLIVGSGAILFNVILLPLLPFDAADVYDYMVRGRMTAFYGLNPMRDPPSQIRTDVAYPFSAWHDATSAYGPAWESMAAVLALIAGNDLVTNVLVFKLFSVVSELLTALLIGFILRKVAPDRALLGVYLFTWNPIVPFFAGGSGHNDFVMVAFVLLSIYCLIRRWYVGAVLAAVLGALVKFIPALLLPLIMIIAWRELQGRTRLKAFVAMGLLSGIAIVAFYAPYWVGLGTLALDRRSHLFTGSFGTLLKEVLDPLIGSDNAATVVSAAGWLAFGAFCLVVIIRFWRTRERPDAREPLQLVSMLVRLLLFYLLIVVSWFQPWYVIWVLPLAVLLEDSPIRRITLLFSYMVTWQALIYNYVMLRYDGWAPLPWRDLIPVAVVIGGVLVYGGLYSIMVTRRILPQTKKP